MSARLLFALGLSFVVFACGDEGSVPAPDTGTPSDSAIGDSGLEDGGDDAGDDAGIDAAIDTGTPVDAAVDTGTRPDAAVDAAVDATVVDGGPADAAVDASGCSAPCDDGVYCNGVETCVRGACVPGTAVVVDDGVSCTVDSCDEATMSVFNTPDPAMCPVGRNTCAAGELTTRAATCDSAAGCGLSTTTSPCPTARNTCQDIRGPVHTAYAPTCASRSTCDPTGTPTVTRCATPPVECVGDVHTTYAASCTRGGGCGSTVTNAEDCAAGNSTVCARSVQVATTCSCDAADGCECAITRLDCSAPRCASRTTSVVCAGCTSGACSGCRITRCATSCDPRSGTCSGIAP